eukprot:gene9162-8253_t
MSSARMKEGRTHHGFIRHESDHHRCRVGLDVLRGHHVRECALTSNPVSSEWSLGE